MEVEEREANVVVNKQETADHHGIDTVEGDPVVDEEKRILQSEITRLEQTVQETELKCQKYLEEKKRLKSNINHLKKQLVDVKTKLNIANVRYEESAKKLTEATSEWKAFQQDLLTTVKVANDLKIEAQENVERLTVKNKKLNERIPILEAEIDRLRRQLSSSSSGNILEAEIDRLRRQLSSSSGNNHPRSTDTFRSEEVPELTANVEEQKDVKVIDHKFTESRPVAETVEEKKHVQLVTESRPVAETVEEKKDEEKKIEEKKDVQLGDVVDGMKESSAEKDATDAKMLPPKVVPRRSVSVQPFCVSVAPRSPLRSISIDPVPSNTANTSNNQLAQGPRSRDPLSYPSSRKSIAKYVDFRTASQMSVKNLIMSLENASKNPPVAPPTIVTSPVPSPAVVVLRQQSSNGSSPPSQTHHQVVTSRFSNPEPRTIEPRTTEPRITEPRTTESRTVVQCNADSVPPLPMKGLPRVDNPNLNPSSGRSHQVTTVTIRGGTEPSDSSLDEVRRSNKQPTKRPVAITSSLELIPTMTTHEEYTQAQNKNNEIENNRQKQVVQVSKSSPIKTPMSSNSPTSPSNKPLVLFKMENLRSNFR